MNIEEKAVELGKKLLTGDRKEIARMTGISVSTVYACLEGRKTKPLGEDKVLLVMEAAIKIIEDRSKRKELLTNKIDKL